MTQVLKDHYSFLDYINQERWGSYYEQIKNTIELKVRKILIIGVGDGIVSDVLKKQGFEVKTFDIDESLNPDYIGNLENIDKILEGESFDLIICCQVLEHLVYEKFETILRMLREKSKFLILSLPFSHHKIIEIKINFLRINFRILVPKFYKSWNFDGQHYWEIGCKNYNFARIKTSILKSFNIRKSYISRLNSYHVFYICEQ